ncbi:MAG: phenylalanine--tRNA ligase subunit alpha, partial [Candidatus Omnitrophica bacterium]|nr:phenylalanine--tRNA ligase subunit alpha [Candidatus Omnitrophota bacterium]
MDIESLKTQVDSDIQNINSPEALEEFRVKYLGRKGILAQLTSSIPSLPPEQRGILGQQANALKNKISNLIEERQRSISPKQQEGVSLLGDIGMPGIAQDLGRLHPVTQIIDEICNIFMRMGFSVVEGPEIETEYNNFTGLNIPLEHPSRDAFDTFYLKNAQHLLLRSHTSPVQIRAMKSSKPPLAVVVPGRVYRPDAVDASHSFMFHQIEGFMVDEGIKFSDLKGVLESFARAVFGQDIKMRFRPHFFPFTEPSAEVDISCIICKGKGCSVCGRKGWLEILGSGMIHPNVFKHVGYNPKKYSGFAFGMGVERIAMLKYGINDIRLFFENDLRFLK